MGSKKEDMDKVQENSLTSNPGGRSPERESADKEGPKKGSYQKSPLGVNRKDNLKN